MILARQSTAIIVTVGPVMDADGVAVTDCVVGDFKLSKNGAAPAALNGSATLTHRNTGHYSLSLTATDVNTVGTAEVVIDDTVNACPVKEIQIVEEAVYDAQLAASAVGIPSIPANWLTAAGTAADFSTELRTAINGGDYALSTDANGRVRIVDGTGTGELDTSSGHVTLADGSLVTAKLGTFVLAKTTNITGFNDLSAANVQTEAEEALQTYHLDHLIASADPGAIVANSSLWAALVSKSATPAYSSYVNTTDSLEALRDNTGTAGAGLTAADDATLAAIAALNNIAAADVWAVGTRTLTALGFTLAAADLAAGIITSGKFAAGAIDAAAIATGAIDADALATDGVQEIRDAITGGAYSLSTDANGRLRIVDGTAAGELDTSSGAVILTSAERNSIADALLDRTDGIESSITPRQAWRYVAAACAGILSGAATGTITIKGIGQASGGTTRITATVDADGNRSALTLA